MRVKVEFSENLQAFGVGFNEGQAFKAEFGEVQAITEYIGGEPYVGDYIVTPKVSEQTMETKDKVMTDDVTIKSIPFFNVSNNSGGTTVYIGSEVNYG